MRPRIGLTTSLEAGEQRVDLRYVTALERAGALPLIVPILDDDAAADEFAALLDGLVVIGGPGVVVGLVGELPDEIAPVDERRWRSDARILQRFLDAGRPALGICYGMQLANALRGGTIWADVQRQVTGALPHSERRGAPPHAVTVLAGTHLRHVVGTDSLTVPTHHLQSVHQAGSGLAVSAIASDGVVEAIETPDGSFLGVQFHPERMGDEGLALFEHVVQSAEKAAGRSPA